MSRRIDLDVLRGVLLCVMAVNHTPGPLRQWTEQPLGFVSAAEGFVFLSAYLVGDVSQQRLTHGLRHVTHFALGRATRLYLAHVGMLLFLFAVAVWVLRDLPSFYNFAVHALDRPLPTLLSALLLLYQPPLFDILPLYVVFLALTPGALWVAQRTGWLVLLTFSSGLWAYGFFHLRYDLIGVVARHDLISPGAFNVFGWQLIWLCGLGLGQRLAAEQGRVRVPRVLALSACVLVLLFFSWRSPLIPFAIDLGEHVWLLDKWQLGPLRLLNFAALVTVVYWCAPGMGMVVAHLRPLAALGRNGLPVFCVHVCATFVAIGLIETLELGDAVCLGILGLQLVLLFRLANALGSQPT